MAYDTAAPDNATLIAVYVGSVINFMVAKSRVNGDFDPPVCIRTDVTSVLYAIVVNAASSVGAGAR